MLSKVFRFAVVTMLLSACTPTMANRGNILDQDKLAEVQPQSSTREQVASALGTPTAISTFDDKTWYYVGRQTAQYSFFDPIVVKQQAIRVQFNDDGIVREIRLMDLSEAHDIDAIERATPTYGNDDTFIRQLLGNLGHATPNMGTHRQGN